MIKCGKKIYEIRLNDEKRQLMKVGDTLVFKREPEMLEKLHTEIKELIYFKSFEEMLENIASEDIGFHDVQKLDILNLYYKFYSKEEEKKYGVVAVKMNNIK